MKARNLLSAAYEMAIISSEEIHKKWISVSFKIGGIAGNVHIISLQRNGRLDMMLRLLESEQLEWLKDDQRNELDWSLELQLSLSENWLLSAYEITRAVKEQLELRDEDMPKLVALQRRLSLVRMPIAKGEIQGMNRKMNRENPPLLIRTGENIPSSYQNDGSYIMPLRLCGETGAALWHPVDLETHKTVAICRRDLSDELLSLFD